MGGTVGVPQREGGVVGEVATMHLAVGTAILSVEVVECHARGHEVIHGSVEYAATGVVLGVYLYAREGCQIAPQQEQAVFLTMAHMGDGIKEITYEITVEGPLKPIYRFVAEFIYEDSQNNKAMEVPFVLVSENGVTVPVKWEKRGPAATPNMPRI